MKSYRHSFFPWRAIAGRVSECLAKDHTECDLGECGPHTYPLHWMREDEIRLLLELADHLRGYHDPGTRRPKTGPAQEEEPEPSEDEEPEPSDAAIREVVEAILGNSIREAAAEADPDFKHELPEAAPEVAVAAHIAQVPDRVEQVDARGNFVARYRGACSCGWQGFITTTSLGAATAQTHRHIETMGAFN